MVLSAKLGKFDNMVIKTKALLKLVNTVARNDVNDAVNQILDSLTDIPDANAQSEMYVIILESLKASNERLWFNTSLRLGRIYLEQK